MDHSDFKGQFVLGTTRDIAPEGWRTQSIDSWVLASHDDLRVLEIKASDGVRVGWLLGCPIDIERRAIPAEIGLDVGSDDPDFTDRLEGQLYQLGGRYTVVCLSPRAWRIYLDPCGLSPAVFSAQRGMVASSLGLIPDEGDSDHDLIEALDIPAQDNWYPFGLTARRSVQRLLPNHFLDLATWVTERHWPRSESIPSQYPSERAVAEIASILIGQMETITSMYRPYLSLTAGRDSRVILAATRGDVHRIQAFTSRTPDNSLDAEIASHIARTVDLDHVILDSEEASDLELRRWLERTGTCVAGATWRLARTTDQLEPDRPRIGGSGGEMIRHYYWRPGDTSPRELDPKEVLQRVHLPECEALLLAARRWLDDLPSRGFLAMLDLLYIEQRMGCWRGPAALGNFNSLMIQPFCHRRIIEIALSLESEYRRERLMIDLLRHLWPDLLRFPFNRRMGVRGAWDRCVRVWRRSSHRVKRRLRISSVRT